MLSALKKVFTKPSSSSGPTCTNLQSAPYQGLALPQGFCQSKSYLPWVSDVNNGTPTTPLVCASTINLKIPNYVAYPYQQMYKQYINQRLIMSGYDRRGNGVDLYKMDNYCVVPQGCSITQIISIQLPLDTDIKIAPQSCASAYESQLQSESDEARKTNQNIYNWAYILKFADPDGNQHYLYQADKFVAGHRSLGFQSSMIPDITPFSGNVIITGSIQLTGIYAYSIYDFPKQSVVSFSFSNGMPFNFNTNSAEISQEYGGFITFQTASSVQRPGSVSVPQGMKVIGLGCTFDCRKPVVVMGYDYDVEDFLYYDPAIPGFPGLTFMVKTYPKEDVVKYLMEMVKWTLTGGLNKKYRNEADLEPIKRAIMIIVSGQYNLYKDINLFSGKLDELMSNYCFDSKDPLCSCYDVSGAGSYCQDRKCQSTGYKSTKILSTNCDPYNSNGQIIGLLKEQKDNFDQQLRQLQYQTDQANSTNKSYYTQINGIQTQQLQEFDQFGKDMRQSLDKQNVLLTNSTQSQLDLIQQQHQQQMNAVQSGFSSQGEAIQLQIKDGFDKQNLQLDDNYKSYLSTAQEKYSEMSERQQQVYDQQTQQISNSFNKISEFLGAATDKQAASFKLFNDDLYLKVDSMYAQVKQTLDSSSTTTQTNLQNNNKAMNTQLDDMKKQLKGYQSQLVILEDKTGTITTKVDTNQKTNEDKMDTMTKLLYLGLFIILVSVILQIIFKLIGPKKSKEIVLSNPT